MKFIDQLTQIIQSYDAQLIFNVYARAYGLIFVFLFLFTLLFSLAIYKTTPKKILKLMGKCFLYSFYVLFWLQWSLTYFDNFFMYMLPGLPFVIVLLAKIWKARRKIKEVCKRITAKDFWN